MNEWPLQSECDKYYGNPRGVSGRYNLNWYRINMTSVHVPWKMTMGDVHITRIQCHKLVMKSLAKVLETIWEAALHDQARIEAMHADKFSSSFNYRCAHDRYALSMHAYGIAIDMDALHFFTNDNPLVQAFEAENWVWGGHWNKPDWAHFQAARLE